MNIQTFLSQPTPYKYELLKITSHVLKIPIEKIYSSDYEIPDNKLIQIHQLFKKYTQKKIPLEYLLWEVDFLENKFFVNENVLIPRPETEYLVQYAIKEIQSKLSSFSSKFSIYDIWTGSGIIWISICKKLNVPVVCSDVSEKALEVAEKNAKSLWCNKLKFIKSNLADHIKNNKDFKIICANLPYVPEDFQLDDYAQKEPKLALFAFNDWLGLYEELINQVENAVLFLELTKKQAQKLIEKYKLQNYEILGTCHENIKVLKIQC